MQFGGGQHPSRDVHHLRVDGDAKRAQVRIRIEVGLTDLTTPGEGREGPSHRQVQVQVQVQIQVEVEAQVKVQVGRKPTQARRRWEEEKGRDTKQSVRYHGGWGK